MTATLGEMSNPLDADRYSDARSCEPIGNDRDELGRTPVVSLVVGRLWTGLEHDGVTPCSALNNPAISVEICPVRVLPTQEGVWVRPVHGLLGQDRSAGVHPANRGSIEGYWND